MDKNIPKRRNLLASRCLLYRGVIRKKSKSYFGLFF